ncbi:MAG: carbon-nitrogen hydrolase family protein [Eubacteriales bacterium]|nr:carbon-nitrogen hydrolase family protein [Eubacteriales bacterium]
MNKTSTACVQYARDYEHGGPTKKASVACIQFAPVTNDKAANIRKMGSWIESVKAEHPFVDLILFPELAINGYDATKEEFRAMAETPEHGDALEAMKIMARICRTYIAYGYAEDGGEDMYNSMIMIGRDGEVVENYRKIHPFADEKKWCVAGEEWKVAETDFGKVGMMICYDTSFPEAAGTLARMGAEMLAISTNWEDPHLYDWDLVTAARAFDNSLHVVSSNRVGRDRILSFSGHSRILSPMGRPICELMEPEEGYIYAELDLEETNRLRSGYYTSIRDRRPNTYK